MKSNSYMDRALQSSDPRFADILQRLGYQRRDMQAQPAEAKDEADELKALRDDYQRVVGKRPFHGWDTETLREKIAEAS